MSEPQIVLKLIEKDWRLTEGTLNMTFRSIIDSYKYSLRLIQTKIWQSMPVSCVPETDQHSAQDAEIHRSQSIIIFDAIAQFLRPT